MTSPRPYAFNPNLRIWETSSHSGGTYSDGDEVENLLWACLQQCKDVSVFSEELRALITDWPTQYHLSPERTALLRPFSIGPGDCVLELGCGCGALTRYLGETGAKVIAVEGSQRRAAITAERCRDLPNVSVHCDNLLHFDSTERFSHVTLIGVLEYSRVFCPGRQPELECLQSATRWLNDGGQLVLAIENQFGLKYFNGCAEDHLNIPSFGLHDLYSLDSPVTFGHFELQQLIMQAGLTTQEWIYPLPDYKLPTHLIHSRALSTPNFSVGDLLSDTCSRDYNGRWARTFHEGMVWRGLARNQLLPALANSFLVSARKAAYEPSGPIWLAASFNLQRQAAFCTQTMFVTRPGGAIEVHKHCLVDARKADLPPVSVGLQHTPAGTADYIVGSLHASEFQRQAARANTISDLQLWLQQWLMFLCAEQSLAGLDSSDLPGHLVDAIPSNLVADATGQLQLIDVEWQMASAIPMNWVLIRGTMKALASAPPSRAFEGLTFGHAVAQLMSLVGVVVTPADLEIYVGKEHELQQACQASPVSRHTLRNTLHTEVYSSSTLGLAERETESLRNEINRIKRTWYWRIMSPWRMLLKVISRQA